MEKPKWEGTLTKLTKLISYKKIPEKKKKRGGETQIHECEHLAF